MILIGVEENQIWAAVLILRKRLKTCLLHVHAMPQDSAVIMSSFHT